MLCSCQASWHVFIKFLTGWLHHPKSLCVLRLLNLGCFRCRTPAMFSGLPCHHRTQCNPRHASCANDRRTPYSADSSLPNFFIVACRKRNHTSANETHTSLKTRSYTYARIYMPFYTNIVRAYGTIVSTNGKLPLTNCNWHLQIASISRQHNM